MHNEHKVGVQFWLKTCTGSSSGSKRDLLFGVKNKKHWCVERVNRTGFFPCFHKPPIQPVNTIYLYPRKIQSLSHKAEALILPSVDDTEQLCVGQRFLTVPYQLYPNLCSQRFHHASTSCNLRVKLVLLQRGAKLSN